MKRATTLQQGYPSDQRGVCLAVGDVNRDGRKDIVTSGMFGTSPTVRVFSGINNAVIRNIALPGASPSDPYTVAAGDTNKDGYAEVAVDSPASHITVNDVLVYSGFNGALTKTFVSIGQPSDANRITGPVYTFVAAGDLTGDGADERAGRSRIFPSLKAPCERTRPRVVTTSACERPRGAPTMPG